MAKEKAPPIIIEPGSTVKIQCNGLGCDQFIEVKPSSEKALIQSGSFNCAKCGAGTTEWKAPKGKAEKVRGIAPGQKEAGQVVSAIAPGGSDRLLPIGVLSEREQVISDLLRYEVDVGAPLTAMFDDVLAVIVERAVEEYASEGQSWLRAWGDRITKIELSESAAPIFHLWCGKCKGDAVFTAEGPNDEYPEPLCERCESGGDHE